ncbi:MAG: RagB/SusD family nutrient uptake outer membrane protein [Paludibacteraceae bacterium]|nr:RagB/SusD family nutrient uptake outer membrane protein [Paludibacteraceae bacterium]
MRKIQFIIVLALTALFAVSCSENYLTQEPSGSTITEEQFYRMDNALEGLIKGAYPNLFINSDGHDYFAQRAIDMYGDLLCGDMALRTQNYGWFATDELMQTYGRRGYLWAYYYTFIRTCNKAINALEAKGLPQLEFKADTLTEEALYNGMYYAEVLTLRGWAYAGLSRFFVPVEAAETDLSVPIYTESDTRVDTVIGRPRATVSDLYLQIENDLDLAIQYFEAYSMCERDSKIEVNADVARITLAYSFLNKGEYANALKWAKEAINKGDVHLLPFDEVLTTGFNNVENKNWIWGEDVTVQNTTSLASFFGQCDIYSYSYASAGDVKGIDQILYDAIPAWDVRKGWWNNYASSGAKDADDFKYAPDGKFYSATSKKLQGDRDWLSDNIYMRWELAYLIAAEAAARANDLGEAQTHLLAITDLRVLPDQTDAYNTWKMGIISQDDWLAAIKYNWRVELWGEGYGLQTFRRYQEKVSLGENHLSSNKKDNSINPAAANMARYFTFELPSGELYYNPYLRESNEDTQNLKKKTVGIYEL